MSNGRTERIEAAVDAGASLLFAAAVAYFLLTLSDSPALSSALAGLSYFAGYYGLRRVQPQRAGFAVRQFATPELAGLGLEELVLTDADRLPAVEVDKAMEELLLDRPLAQVWPDSRVVQLFAAAPIPTPGELKARIDRHLAGPGAPAAQDASEALVEALTQLRRSLR
jgi:hypothetical protein